jgi:diguanylate cyclase (GGDEF)-like protein
MLKKVLKGFLPGRLDSALRVRSDAAWTPRSRLRELMRTDQDFDIMLVNVRDFSFLRELYGSELSQEIEDQLLSILNLAASERMNIQPVSMTLEPGEYLLCWPSQEGNLQALHDATYEIRLNAQCEANAHVLRWAGRELEFGFACARLKKSPGTKREARLLQAVNEARLRAKVRVDLSHLSLTREFNGILADKSVCAVFQPIADFSSGSILGWEALARGPLGSAFHLPAMLFDFAEQSGKLFALERICREKAIATLGPIAPEQKLFFNVHPKALIDPEFIHDKTHELFQAAGLSPNNIVFEITARQGLVDFALFHRTLDHYRCQGFLVAVVDAGDGYSGLSTVAQIRPEFIKIGKSLIQGIEKDPVKRALLETMVAFADKIGSKIIAEGTESKIQAACLSNICVHYGQGNYLAKPDMPKPPLSVVASHLHKPEEQLRDIVSCLIPVGNLVDAAQTRPRDMPVPEVHQCFIDGPLTSIVVVDNDKPVGLIMEYHLNRELSGLFGLALLAKRSIDTIMDRHPLIVDEAQPLEQTAKAAMQREKIKAYDDIIVTRHGNVLGIVTVQRILNTLADVQVEMAKGANPLTGIPGNISLEREVEATIASGRKFSIAYADLDNFKVYNDVYGFTNGDRVIRLAGDILARSARRHGDDLAKLFHIGGDDFVLLAQPEHIERICIAATRCFKRLIRACYSPEDRKRGEVIAVGRDGLERSYPLMSLSLGIMKIVGPCTLLEIGERAAYVKKYAKSLPGNVYAWDRRGPIGLEQNEDNRHGGARPEPARLVWSSASS